jgi:hypothetical protein
MKRAVAVLALGLILLGAAAALAATRPALRLVSTQPAVVVRGTHFRPAERVRVTLYLDMTMARRWVRTTSTGVFTASLGAPEDFDPCMSSFSVTAVGAAGEHATVKFIPRECPPSP